MSEEKKSSEEEPSKTDKMLMPREILNIWQELVIDFKVDNVDKDLYLNFVKQNSAAGRRARKKLRNFRDVSAKIVRALVRLEKAKAAGEHIDYPTENEE